MKVCRTLDEWNEARRAMAGTVGLVPTMGALHDGHAALIRRCVAENEHAVLSVFVNPTQFNDAGDLKAYPETPDSDLALARDLGVRAAWLPDYATLYPDGYRYRVSETGFSRELCGRHRPGHFTGVLTVVLKLLNIVRPQRAYFGEKDYQQYVLVRDMCDALFLDTEIVVCPTVREADGLAMSSRNRRLAPESRALAPMLHRLLASGLDDAAVYRALTEAGFAVDYVETRRGRRFAAAVIGDGPARVRLIDNLEIDAVEESR